jgi:hypothetical protein
MNLEKSVQKTEPYILIEGPRWGDAEFNGKWLLTAAKAACILAVHYRAAIRTQ